MSATGENVTTDFLVLRKTPYGESSLVIAGITPAFGRLGFLVRGARTIGKRQFPVVDLFRVLHVQFRFGRGELQHWRGAESVRDFGAVARDVRAFTGAVWLTRFALGNVFAGVGCPRFFDALLLAFQRLADAAAGRAVTPEVCRAVTIGACLVFLDENGNLSAYDDDAAAARRCRELLAMAAGQREVLRLELGVWEQLWEWLLALLRYAECTVPD